MFTRLVGYAVGLFAVIAIQGCANLNSIYRPIAVEGKAVAIDGYQTPVFSGVIDISQDPRNLGREGGPINRNVICPSPPVDAIATHSFGTGLTNVFSSPTAKDSTQFSLADVMAAASIGLRTNSTTLLSYNSAWNCLAYMGGATTDPKFMELARRNQNITLGILAIEQVTGVIKAGQATLGGTSAGATGTDDTTALLTSLDTARKDKNAALTAVDQKKLTLAGEQAKLPPLAKATMDARAALVALPATATADQKTAVQKNVDDALVAQNTQTTAVKTAQLDVDAANREVERTGQSFQSAEGALSQAQMRVKASASANASITAAGGPQAAATKEIAAAVTAIVTAVLFESGRGEACNNVFEDYIKTPAKYSDGVGSKLFDFCVEQKKVENSTQNQLLLRLPGLSFPNSAPAIPNTPNK